MCIIIFSFVRNIAVNMQDIISVLAFAIILSSQFLGGVLEEKLEKQKAEKDSAQARYEECRERLKEIQDPVRQLLDDIKLANSEKK